MKKENPGVAWVMFAKTPEKGMVKTRLSRLAGENFAMQYYLCMLEQQKFIVQRISQNKNNTLYIYHAGSTGKPLQQLRERFKSVPKIRFKKQAKGNLGQKMERCFRELFIHHERVVLWGSDAILLNSSILLSASLTKNDCFISPCSDGGYGLIALQKQAYKTGFMDNIAWSGRYTLRDQLQNLQKFDISYELGKILPDMDTPADVLRTIQTASQNDDIPEYAHLLVQVQSLFMQS